jgi:O-antigen/teichoic acid export membrane protein
VFSYISVIVPILILVFFLKDWIGNFLLSNNYEQGFQAIFWISLAFAILTTTYLFESLFYATGQTKIILLANIISALVNILSNIMLIPFLGLFGAALATCLGFGVHFLVILIAFKRL